MKNQQERRNGNRGSNSYQGNREEQNGNRGRYDSGNSNFGGNRGNNSGYEDQDMNSTYGSQGRRGENYGFGSQENNDSYRNFSTQGRNSGLGNQGGYSSFGDWSDRDYDRRGNEDWNRNERDSYRNSGDRDNSGWRDYQGAEWNSGRSSYRPYNEGEYHPGSTMSNRGEDRYGMGNSNAGQGFGTSYQDASRGGQGWDSGNMGRMGQNSFGESEQSHRGKGPKGYQRSDERIEESVNDRLTDDHMPDASEIEVKVSKGEVTLTGTVSSREDKRRAEELAEAVSGVSNVENRIRVSKSNERSQTDSNQENTSKSRSESSTEKNKTKQTANGAHV